MSTKRRMQRDAARRTEAAKRLASRPKRRMAPQARADRRAKRAADAARHAEWLASLTPEQRERHDVRETQRMQSLMAICAPALIGALRTPVTF